MAKKRTRKMVTGVDRVTATEVVAGPEDWWVRPSGSHNVYIAIKETNGCGYSQWSGPFIEPKAKLEAYRLNQQFAPETRPGARPASNFPALTFAFFVGSTVASGLAGYLLGLYVAYAALM